MDLVEDTKATPPDCWAGYKELLAAVEAKASANELTATTQHPSALLAVAAKGEMSSENDLPDRLTQYIEAHAGTPEAILAARYLSMLEEAPEVVVPFCARVLHEILHADKLTQMEDLAVEVITAMSQYGEDAARHALDVVGCLLLDSCPAKVKHIALEFVLQMVAPLTCTVVFEQILRRSKDPDITQWLVGRTWGEEIDYHS